MWKWSSHLNNWGWPLRDLQTTIQDQTNDTISRNVKYCFVKCLVSEVYVCYILINWFTLYIQTYTGCFILSDMVNLANQWFFWKIFLKNFSNESCIIWRRTHDKNVYLTLSDFVKIKFIIVFLNGNPYFLLHILVIYLESFSKHYNKVMFHWVLSELWGLKARSTTDPVN